MTEFEQRAAVVAEALTWLGPPPTRFHHNSSLKGIAADCETFIREVFHRAGIFTARGVPYVPDQWFLNQKEELYLKYLSRYAVEYEMTPEHRPRPGDVICVKARWVYSHAALVVEWPTVIHCHPPCVMTSNVFSNPLFVARELKFFDPWGAKA